MPALAEGEWHRLWIELESGAPVAALARRYGVSRGAIQKRIRSGRWHVARLDRPQPVDARMLDRAVKEVVSIAEPLHRGDRNYTPTHQHERLADAAGDETPADGEALPDNPTDAKRSLTRVHRQQWDQVHRLMEMACEAMLDDGFRAADVDSALWTHLDRVAYAHRLISMFALASSGLLQAQEGQRRAFGIDYKVQEPVAKSSGDVAHCREELIRRIKQLFKDQQTGRSSL